MLILDSVIKFINENNLIEEKDHIVVGFSGGPDSVFLLEVLKEYKSKIDKSIKYSLVHVNHQLRGEDSDKDEKFCKDFAKEMKLDILVEKIDIDKMSKELKIGHEEAGREARIKAYEEGKKLFGGNKVALAHNKDDVVETFLFRMIRGSSLEGLEGISINKRGIIRPIINEYKSDILNYLNSRNIPYCIDNSNFESDYTRNSIRLELIPFIEKRYNPKFKDKIIALVDDIKESNKDSTISIESVIEDKKIVIEKLKEHTNFIQKKILGNYINSFNIKIDRYKINSMIELLGKGGTKKVSLTGEYFLVKDYTHIYIKKIDPSFKNGIKETENSIGVNLTIPGEIKFNGWSIKATIDTIPQFGNESFATSLKKGDVISIRNRQPGDKIVPLGMENSKKIKDILINEKIPVEEREKIPVLTIEDETIWVATVVKSETFALKRNHQSKEIINIKVRRL